MSALMPTARREAQEAAVLLRLEGEALAQLRVDDYSALLTARIRAEMALEATRADISDENAPYFAAVAPGRYAVQSVGEAGVVRTEFEGFHYPYQALAKAEELNAAKGNRREWFFASNFDDPESSVEAEDEAYFEEVAHV